MIAHVWRRLEQDEQGFSLTELLVVIAIIAVLAAIVSLSLGGLTQHATSVRDHANRASIQAAVDAYLAELITPAQYDAFRRDLDLDFATSLAGVGRFRVNATLQRGTVRLAVRYVQAEASSLDALGLPPVCAALAERLRGLVLVTGPAGAGKSTTLAALLDHICGRACWR